MEIKTESKAKPKHRARRAKVTANPAASLLAALKFVAVAQKKTGTVQQQFGMISGNCSRSDVCCSYVCDSILFLTGRGDD